MNDLVPFDYGDLESGIAEFACEHAQRIRQLARSTAETIVEIGRTLTLVKECLGHGKFLEWVNHEFHWNERSARRFMMVYEQFKTDNLADLDIDVSALYLIAAPNTPKPVRLELMRRAEAGERVTHAIAHAAIDASHIKAQKEALDECEAIIDRGGGLQPFAEASAALREIRDKRLYLESHQTFEDYYRERWGLPRGLVEVGLDLAP